MDTAIVVCLHGNELFGLEVLDRLSDKLSVYIGNPLAIEKRTRYIEEDLNRSFPGKKEGNYEEKRAYYLVNKLKKYTNIIDVHSSSGNVELFGIITKPNQEKMNLASRLGLKRVILMPESFGKGKALIDHLKCAISLEIGPHEKKENVEDVIKAIENINKNKPSDPEIYEIFDIIKEPEENIEPKIKNFKPVKKGDLIAKGKKDYFAEEDFIPVFVGEKSYKGILCLATRKLDSKPINL